MARRLIARAICPSRIRTRSDTQLRRVTGDCSQRPGAWHADVFMDVACLPHAKGRRRLTQQAPRPIRQADSPYAINNIAAHARKC